MLPEIGDIAFDPHSRPQLIKGGRALSADSEISRDDEEPAR